jgi:hypothetical protein
VINLFGINRKQRNGITEEDIQAVKQIDLERFCLNVLGCERHSRGNMFSPFREEKKPSFSVKYMGGQWKWKDWGSVDEENSSGDIIKLVKLVYNVDFVEAMRFLLKNEFPAEFCQKEQKSREEEETQRENQVRYAKKQYEIILKTSDMTKVVEYFQSRGVNYYYPIGAGIRNDFKDNTRYVAVPIPNLENIRALECRELNGEEKETLGCGTLWFYKRDPRRILATESILDSLAGEIVLNEKGISLCALNGVGFVEKLRFLVEQYHPEEIYLALDNDNPGRKAQDKAIELISRYSPRTGIILVEDHVKAGVKDLHKLLLTKRPPSQKKAAGDDH